MVDEDYVPIPFEVWDSNNGMDIPMPSNIKNFLNDIQEVCRKYELSISHEDGNGGFIISKYSKSFMEWFNDASTNMQPLTPEKQGIKDAADKEYLEFKKEQTERFKRSLNYDDNPEWKEAQDKFMS